ncbi:MAG: 4-(cytidine 5'-diphospho)-2-C-methyl-D-erythritol kinase [Cucumibacter sp.]
MAEALVEPAPAKINLALHVVGRCDNGFHELHGLTVFTELSDELEALPASADRLELKGPFAAGLGASNSNLIRRAVDAFRAEWPGQVKGGVAIVLNKMLPVASGIGGGSADAAAALRIMSRLSTRPPDPARLIGLAATIGADVPMCLLSQACEISGVGDIVRPLAVAPRFHLVLVNPLLPVPTAEVFRRLGHPSNAPMPPLPDGLDHLSVLSLWLADTRNDLEAAAISIAPAIGVIKGAVAGTQGCVLARMSGSGATVFGLYGSGTQAMQAARDLRPAFPAYWIAATPLLTERLN